MSPTLRAAQLRYAWNHLGMEADRINFDFPDRPALHSHHRRIPRSKPISPVLTVFDYTDNAPAAQAKMRKAA